MIALRPFGYWKKTAAMKPLVFRRRAPFRIRGQEHPDFARIRASRALPCAGMNGLWKVP